MKRLRRISTAFLLPIGLFILACAVFPNIGVGNLGLLLRQSVGSCIIAWGVAFELKSGNWDFSLGSVCALSAIVGGNLCREYFNGSLVMLFLLCTATACVLGVITSTVYHICKIPTILVTIGMVFVYEGLTAMLFQGGGIALDHSMVVLGTLPYNAIVFVLLFAAADFLFYYTKTGCHICAVGKNPEVAFFNGIDVYRTKRCAMIIAAFFAGCYAFYVLGYNGVQRSVAGLSSMSVIFDAMMCVFIAFALEKLVNIIVGICIGAFSLQLLSLMLLSVGFPSKYNSAVIAAIVLVLMILDAGTIKIPVWKGSRKKINAV